MIDESSFNQRCTISDAVEEEVQTKEELASVVLQESHSDAVNGPNEEAGAESKKQKEHQESPSKTSNDQEAQPDQQGNDDATVTTDNTVESIRSQLIEIYSVHAPNKVKNIDKMLQKYAGKEEQVLMAASVKYGIMGGKGVQDSNPYGYGDITNRTTNSGRGSRESGSRRPCRRGSVTKYSLEAQQIVANQYNYTNAATQSDSGDVFLPLNDDPNRPAKYHDDASDDGIDTSYRSFDSSYRSYISEDGELEENDKKDKKDKKKRFGRFRIKRSHSKDGVS